MAKKKQSCTAGDIYLAMAKRFATPAYTILPQVADGTGRHKVRTADAIAISVWPSRGLHFEGIEIKISYSDFRRELAAPAKSESIQRFCRHWWIAAPKGCVPVDELPATWGLLEFDGRGLRAAKNAPELSPAPPDMPIVCSILRSVAKATITRSEVDPAIRTAFRDGERVGELRGQGNVQDIRRSIQRFEDVSGITIERYQEGNIGEAVRLIRQSNITEILAGAYRLRNELDFLRKRLGDLGPLEELARRGEKP